MPCNDLAGGSPFLKGRQNRVPHDFEASIEKARKGDFVYCDQAVAHDNNGFARCNEKIFHGETKRGLHPPSHEHTAGGHPCC